MEYEHTELEIEGVIIPIAAAFVHDEDWVRIGSVEEHETWDGESHITAPTYNAKFRITLSASGAGVHRLPNMLHFKGGEIIYVHSRRWLPSSIPIGSDQCILTRDVSHEQVQVRDVETDELVPHVLDGRIVTIAEETDRVLTVNFRPRLQCLFVTFGDGQYSVENGTNSWTLVVREKSAPA